MDDKQPPSAETSATRTSKRRRNGGNSVASPPPKRPCAPTDSFNLNLCRECAQRDLSSAFSKADEFFEANWDLVLDLREWRFPNNRFTGLRLAELGSPISRPNPSCRLCQFFWTMRISNIADALDTEPEGSFELRAFPCYQALPFIKPGNIVPKNRRRTQSSVLLIVPSTLDHTIDIRASLATSAIFRGPTPGFGCVTARHIPSHADLEFLYDWIDFCEKNHGLGCPKSKEKRYSKRVPGFRLVDCATKTIVKASVNWKYAALSYVWGTPDPKSNNKTQVSWPQVVEDAIIVTKRLGLRYLWVDRYCIDQQNAREKHEQIASMNVIYHRARLTITAAAGDDATYGLPGVSRPRSCPPCISLVDLDLITVPTDAHKWIENSTWWGRGWTYQEGVLSRRRVVFTDHQIYYECGGMVGFECYQFPPGNFHSPTLLYQERFIRGGLFSGIAPESGNVNSFRLAASTKDKMREARVLTHISNYSHRNLSYNTDALNAFQGILTAHRVQSIYGLIVREPLTISSRLLPLGLIGSHRFQKKVDGTSPNLWWVGGMRVHRHIATPNFPLGHGRAGEDV